MGKIIEWVDGDGLPRLSEIPHDAGIEDAPKGVPISIDPLWLPYAKPYRNRLYLALWEEGLRTEEDFQRTDSLGRILQVIKRVIKYDANDVRNAILRGVDHESDF